MGVAAVTSTASIPTSMFPQDVQDSIKSLGFGTEIDVHEMSSALRMLAESKQQGKKLRKVMIALAVIISLYLVVTFGVMVGAAWWVAKATQSMQSQGDRLTNMQGETLRAAGASLNTPVTTVGTTASKLRQLLVMGEHGLPSTHSRVLAAGHDLHPYVELGTHASRVAAAEQRHFARLLTSQITISNTGPGLDGVSTSKPTPTPLPAGLPNCLANLKAPCYAPPALAADDDVQTVEPFYAVFGQAAIDFMAQTCQYKKEGQNTLAWDVTVQWPTSPNLV